MSISAFWTVNNSEEGKCSTVLHARIAFHYSCYPFKFLLLPGIFNEQENFVAIFALESFAAYVRSSNLSLILTPYLLLLITILVFVCNAGRAEL